MQDAPPTTPERPPATPSATSNELEQLRQEARTARAEAAETRTQPPAGWKAKLLHFVWETKPGRTFIILLFAYFFFRMAEAIGFKPGFAALVTFGLSTLYLILYLAPDYIGEQIMGFFKSLAIAFGGVGVFVAIAMSPLPLKQVASTGWIIFYFVIISAAKKLSKVERVLIIFFNGGIFYLFIFTPYYGQVFVPTSPIYQAIEGQQDEFNKVWGGVKSMFGEAERVARSQVHYAMGDYEEGIEAQSERPLGVFLEGIGITSKIVPQDGIIDVYARLRAESFKTEKPLKIKVSCYIEGDKEKKGEIRPADTFIVEEYESQDLDCIMDVKKLGLKIGSREIAMDTLFTFTTGAYLKSYFMTQERVRSYRRQNIDPLDAFKIIDKSPIGVYSAGPLKIGMGAGQQPVALLSPEEFKNIGPTLSITLDKNWVSGDFTKINQINITVPPGLSIRSVAGFEKSELNCATVNEEETCTVEDDILKKIFPMSKTIKTVITPVTLRVHTNLHDMNALMSDAPISIRSFKVSAYYEYRVKKIIGVRVRPVTK